MQILDFLGDIGGFMGALEMIFAIYGSYISGKLMIAQISNDMFLSKKTSIDLKAEKGMVA